MAVMTDNFNRGDATINGTGPSWNILAGGFSTLSNACVPTNAGVDSCARADQTALGGDQYSQVKLAAVSSTNSPNDQTGIGVCLRLNSGGSPTDFYRIVIDRSGMAQNLAIAKEVGGSYSLLGATVSSSTYSSGDLLRVEMSGSSLTVYLAGVSQATRTDTSHTTGQPGLFFSAPASGSTTIDDWEGGDLAAALDSFDPTMLHAGRFGPF